MRSNKKRQIPFGDIFKTNQPILMIFIGCVENIFNFFLENFGGRNFYPRRNFYEKPANGFYENLEKAPYDVKKYFFSKLASYLRKICQISVQMTPSHIFWYTEYVYHNISQIFKILKNHGF